MEDKFKGRAKEAAGAFTGDEEKKAEGQAQQRKGQASEEAAQRAKTRQTEKRPYNLVHRAGAKFLALTPLMHSCSFTSGNATLGCRANKVVSDG